MTLGGTLKGHNVLVTQVATTPQFWDMILFAPRDKTLIMWKPTRDEAKPGIPQRALRAPSHFVRNVVVISSDGQFAPGMEPFVSGVSQLAPPQADL